MARLGAGDLRADAVIAGFLNPRAGLGNNGGPVRNPGTHTMRVTFPLLLLLTLQAPAQSTWIVDASGAPDADFTSIQAAVDAAADGDRILIRAGQYHGFEIVGKGLALHGEAGVQLSATGTLHVVGTQPDQTVTISDVHVRGVSIGSGQGATDCRGRVVLERILFDALTTRPTFARCEDVRARFVDLRLPLRVVDSRLAASDSRFQAGLLYPLGGVGMDIGNSDVTLARCEVSGSLATGFGIAHPAVRLASSSLRLTGDESSTFTASPGTTLTTHAIDGTGSVVRDPRVSLLSTGGAARVAPSLLDTVVPIPDLQVLGDTRAGNRVSVRLRGVEGEIWGLMVGLPGAPVQLPGIGGAIDYTTPIVALQGVFGTEPVWLSYTAVSGLPPGFAFCWQAIASEPGGTWQHSNSETCARAR